MQNFSAGKILSIFFFLVIIALLLIVYKEIEFKNPERNSLLIFAGIFFAVLFLLVLNLTNFISVREKTKQEDSEKKSDKIKKDPEEKERDKIQIKSHTAGILKHINRPNDMKAFSELLLKNFAEELSIVQAIIFIRNKKSKTFKPIESFANYSENNIPEFKEGDGIVGQVAEDKKIRLITDIAEGYITVISGLGSSSPSNLLIIPIVSNNETVAIIELAAFESFPETYKEIYTDINKAISDKFNSLV